MQLRDLIANLPLLKATDQNPSIGSLALDSRCVEQGSLFFALKGRRERGGAYALKALQRGAVALMGEDCEEVCVKEALKKEGKGVEGALTFGAACGRPVAYLQVKDARDALGRLSRCFYGMADEHLKTFGVTGTNGKTSTVHALCYLHSVLGLKAGSVGTLGYQTGHGHYHALPLTTPEAPQLHGALAHMLEESCVAAAMEISSSGLEQQRVQSLRLDAVALLNITRDHLDVHGNFQDYQAIKQGLFTHPSLPKALVLNLDCPRALGAKVLKSEGQRLISFSLREKADFQASNITTSLEGTRCHLKTPVGSFPLFIPQVGWHNLSNVLAALALMYSQNHALASLIASLDELPTPAGRLEEISHRGSFKVFVDYAHTPDALDHVLEVLRSLTEGNLVVVFGCGGDRDRGKRARMAQVARHHADGIVITQDNPRTENPERILEDIQRGLRGEEGVYVENDRAKAIEQALKKAKKGDCVLIAGKGHERYQIIGDAIEQHDDAQVARQYLRA